MKDCNLTWWSTVNKISLFLRVDIFLRFALHNFWLSIYQDFQFTVQQKRKSQNFGRIPQSNLWQHHGSTSPIHNTRGEQRVECFSIKKFPEKFGSIVCGSPRIFSHEHRHYQRGALSWVFGWTSRSSSSSALLLLLWSNVLCVLERVRSVGTHVPHYRREVCGSFTMAAVNRARLPGNTPKN